jgi:hypothetical protein
MPLKLSAVYWRLSFRNFSASTGRVTLSLSSPTGVIRSRSSSAVMKSRHVRSRSSVETRYPFSPKKAIVACQTGPRSRTRARGVSLISHKNSLSPFEIRTFADDSVAVTGAGFDLLSETEGAGGRVLALKSTGGSGGPLSGNSNYSTRLAGCKPAIEFPDHNSAIFTMENAKPTLTRLSSRAHYATPIYSEPSLRFRGKIVSPPGAFPTNDLDRIRNPAPPLR